jgi:hypothetical protein
MAARRRADLRHNPGRTMGVLPLDTEGNSMNDSAAKKRLNSVVLCGVVLAAMMFSVGCVAQAPTSSVPPGGESSEPGPTTDRAGCVLDGRNYVCSFGGFHHVFHRSKTIAIEASPRDQAALTQLNELVVALNRTVAAAGQGDLIFAVLPIDHGGVIIGPGDVDMATLRIYDQGPDGTRGEMLWAETYRGQADRPWPATVHALLRQFQERMAKRYK